MTDLPKKLAEHLVHMPKWLLLSFLAIFVFFVYSNTLRSPFILDDKQNIERNPDVRLTKLTLDNLTSAAFPSRVSKRPIANISFALNYHFHRYDLLGYHLINIFIHIISGILLYILAKSTLRVRASRLKYGSYEWIPFFTASIWLVHPINTQSVTYIVQRMNSMASMFYILALLLYVKGRLVTGHQKRWLWFSGCILAWILAMGSKEIAATLPLFVFLYEWYFFQELSKATLKRYLPYLLGTLGLLALLVFFYLGENPWNAIQSIYERLDFSLTERVLTEFRVVVFYIGLILYPHPSRLNLDHDFPLSHSLTDPLSTLLSMGFIAGFAVFAIYVAKRDRLISFCILWFFGNLVIESSVIGLEIIYEHRTYLPSMLVSLMFVGLAYRYTKSRRLATAILGIIALVLSLWTYERNSVWSDSVNLWKDCAEKSPRKARVHTNLGLALERHGELDKAMESYLRALRIEPKLALAHYNLGIAYGKKGMYRLAFKEIGLAKKFSSKKQWKEMFKPGARGKMPPIPGHP